MDHLAHAYNANVYEFDDIFHAGSVFDRPSDVLADPTLSRSEKRSILASWASDAAAVSSHPALRRVPGMATPVTIDEVLQALKSLDHDPPRHPPGGKSVRIRSTEKFRAAA